MIRRDSDIDDCHSDVHITGGRWRLVVTDRRGIAVSKRAITAVAPAAEGTTDQDRARAKSTRCDLRRRGSDGNISGEGGGLRQADVGPTRITELSAIITTPAPNGSALHQDARMLQP